jgi:hypothetical protein
MRAMLPRERWSQAQSRDLVRFCSEPAHSIRKADLLRKLEARLPLPAASKKQLAAWPSCFMEKGRTVPTSGLRPHEGRFHPNAFRNIY